MTSRSASTDGRTCMYVYAQRAGKAAAAAAEAGARDRQGTLRLEEDAPRKIRIYIYMYVRLAVVFLFVCSSTRLPARVPSASPPFSIWQRYACAHRYGLVARLLRKRASGSQQQIFHISESGLGFLLMKAMVLERVERRAETKWTSAKIHRRWARCGPSKS